MQAFTLNALPILSFAVFIAAVNPPAFGGSAGPASDYVRPPENTDNVTAAALVDSNPGFVVRVTFARPIQFVGFPNWSITEMPGVVVNRVQFFALGEYDFFFNDFLTPGMHLVVPANATGIYALDGAHITPGSTVLTDGT